MAKSRFAVCLFQEEFVNLKSAELITGEDLHLVKTSKIPGLEFMVYQRQSNPHEADWINIVGTFCELDTKYINSSSAGAILIIKVKNRLFGCCFGSSVSNVNRSSIVSDFGLACAFQRMIKNQTKTIGSFTLTSNPITNNRSSAIPTTKAGFNLDTFLENITELSGFISAENNRKNLIKGKEFYSSPLPSSIKKIHELCVQLLVDYLLAINNNEFKRLTSARKIKDRKEIDELNKELCKSLNNLDEDVHLVDFETLDESSNYKFSLKGNSFLDLTINDFYSEFKKKREIEFPYLKSQHILVSDSNDTIISRWPLYKCLFMEIDYGVNKAIIYRGVWYEIQNQYLQSLRSFIDGFEIDNASDLLPEWDGHEREDAYNLKAAEFINGQCWDKILYTHADYDYGIEFCDVLSDDYIIHIKRGNKSSLNSHLLLQTAVSAKLYKEDVEIRKWIYKTSKKKFGSCFHLKKNGSLKNDETKYLILLLRNDGLRLSESLPFFSLISFNMVIKQIEQMGLTVKVGSI